MYTDYTHTLVTHGDPQTLSEWNKRVQRAYTLLPDSDKQQVRVLLVTEGTPAYLPTEIRATPQLYIHHSGRFVEPGEPSVNAFVAHCRTVNGEITMDRVSSKPGAAPRATAHSNIVPELPDTPRKMEPPGEEEEEEEIKRARPVRK